MDIKEKLRQEIAYTLVVYHRRTKDLEEHYSGMQYYDGGMEFVSRAVKLDNDTADQIIALTDAYYKEKYKG